MSDSKAPRRVHGIVHRRSVLGGAVVTAMAGVLGRWRKRAEAAPAAPGPARQPGKRRPVIWLGHM